MSRPLISFALGALLLTSFGTIGCETQAPPPGEDAGPVIDDAGAPDGGGAAVVVDDAGGGAVVGDPDAG